MTKKYSTQVCATMKVVCEILTHVWRARERGWTFFHTFPPAPNLWGADKNNEKTFVFFPESPRRRRRRRRLAFLFHLWKELILPTQTTISLRVCDCVCVCGKLSLISSRSHFGPASWSFVGKDKHRQVQLAWAKTEKNLTFELLFDSYLYTELVYWVCFLGEGCTSASYKLLQCSSSRPLGGGRKIPWKLLRFWSRSGEKYALNEPLNGHLPLLRCYWLYGRR